MRGCRLQCDTVLEGVDLVKEFVQGGVTLQVLRGANIKVRAGERIAIVGASGSGKTTLLQLLGGLGSADPRHRGDRRIGDEPTERHRARATAQPCRRVRLSIPSFAAGVHGARECRHAAAGAAHESARRQAARQAHYWRASGLGERLEHRPSQLSGGERQRAAVARALVTRPKLVLADEPTGNLDGKNAAQVFELMLELNRELGTSLVIVTHDERLAARLDRVLTLADGMLVERGAAARLSARGAAAAGR